MDYALRFVLGVFKVRSLDTSCKIKRCTHP